MLRRSSEFVRQLLRGLPIKSMRSAGAAALLPVLVFRPVHRYRRHVTARKLKRTYTELLASIFDVPSF